MNAIELFHQDGKSAGIFYCGQCRVVARTQAEAESCCTPKLCVCGAALSVGRLNCDACWAKELEQREKAKFDQAAVLGAWTGWIFSEGHGHQQGFFETEEELREWCEDEGVPAPAYAWTCRARAFAQIDLDDILERIEEDGYEDFDARTLAGLPELKMAIKAFNEANSKVYSYEPDYKAAVILEETMPSPIIKPDESKN